MIFSTKKTFIFQLILKLIQSFEISKATNDVSFAVKPSLMFSFALWAFESEKPTPVNKCCALGNSLDITSIKGIEPPQPIKTGSLPLKMAYEELNTSCLSLSWNSGAQKPSATSQRSNYNFAPKVVSSSFVNTFLSLSTTSTPFWRGANLKEHLNLISFAIALPAIARLVGRPYIPITVS